MTMTAQYNCVFKQRYQKLPAKSRTSLLLIFYFIKYSQLCRLIHMCKAHLKNKQMGTEEFDITLRFFKLDFSPGTNEF